ncbi:MAG: hypothetical protein DRR19_12020 [Candidatus Parabeggiatoa sp. nov. 1]|nr:MAG: hypothetical protein DRR19_12020 [Gammaproteobacteria bacterium]
MNKLHNSIRYFRYCISLFLVGVQKKRTTWIVYNKGFTYERNALIFIINLFLYTILVVIVINPFLYTILVVIVINPFLYTILVVIVYVQDKKVKKP